VPGDDFLLDADSDALPSMEITQSMLQLKRGKKKIDGEDRGRERGRNGDRRETNEGEGPTMEDLAARFAALAPLIGQRRSE
jgi:hypothetical protein